MFQKAIAIDGPSGAGKSTIARLVAKELGFRYIDTGAMYRACTLKVLRANLDVNDEAAVSAVAEGISIRLADESGVPFIFMDGENVSDAIRDTDVTANVSVVCRYAAVREAMVVLQRQMADEGGVVMDGRDIGTVVLPNADIKLYLTASSRVRAERRYKEMAAKGTTQTLDEVEQDIIARDYQDMHRENSPLTQAEDALYFDTSDMTQDQVVETISGMIKEKRGQ